MLRAGQIARGSLAFGAFAFGVALKWQGGSLSTLAFGVALNMS